MAFDPLALLRIERAAVHSWPALETANIDGWLWRYSSGGSLRANSIAAFAFNGADVERAIGKAERRYHARGAPARFTVSDVSQPADLDARLAARGYAKGQQHVTMAKQVSATAVTPSDVTQSLDASPEWLTVYLGGLGPDRGPVAPRILAALPSARAFFACKHDDRVVSSGLSVTCDGLASVQCMASVPAARRRGGASAILVAIEAWARARNCSHLYLQAEASNEPAIALYRRFGFAIAGRYHMRTKGCCSG
jgi:ribosomal protein S18 acetylase RimI-like enzyme